MLSGLFAIAAICCPLSVFAAPLKVTTNDTFLSKQWYLDSIHAREGWTVTTGTRDVVVAVVDSGVDIDHDDLKDNIWNNTAEIAGNGKDDDHDGYIDDVHGWNFVSNTGNVHPSSTPDGVEEAWIHGTVVSSLIAGVGNNGIGITGVAWRARIMPLVVLDADGYGKDDQLIGAIRYAVAHGADIINLSLVGYDYDAALADAIREATAQGVLVVSAAGNSDAGDGENLDVKPGYPACNKGVANMGELTVTAIDQVNKRVPKANFGSCVDVSAPGGGMFAARPTHDMQNIKRVVAGYIGDLNGTSVAAPLVSGLAVLLKAEHPTWRGPQLAKRIIDTADSIDSVDPAMAGKMGKGRINVARALAKDDASARLGPLSLEGSAPGNQPMVRVKDENGHVISRFAVGSTGDLRGVRATFVRWQQDVQPDIAVTMIGDRFGAWQVYRPDGLLIAAGSLGSDVSGGALIAAEDLEIKGQDTLLFGEANGRRAWMVSPGQTSARVFYPFSATGTSGISVVSMTKPVPSFFIGTAKGGSVVSVIGNGPRKLYGSNVASFGTSATFRTIRRGERNGDSAIFQIQSDAKTVTFAITSGGIAESAKPLSVTRWTQIPSGEQREAGWWFYQLWPR